MAMIHPELEARFGGRWIISSSGMDAPTPLPPAPLAVEWTRMTMRMNLWMDGMDVFAAMQGDERGQERVGQLAAIPGSCIRSDLACAVTLLGGEISELGR